MMLLPLAVSRGSKPSEVST